MNGYYFVCKIAVQNYALSPKLPSVGGKSFGDGAILVHRTTEVRHSIIYIVPFGKKFARTGIQMEEIHLNEYHKKANLAKMKTMAYWREHPLPLSECLQQLQRLREQRIAREKRC